MCLVSIKQNVTTGEFHIIDSFVLALFLVLSSANNKVTNNQEFTKAIQWKDNCTYILGLTSDTPLNIEQEEACLSHFSYICSYI